MLTLHSQACKVYLMTTTAKLTKTQIKSFEAFQVLVAKSDTGEIEVTYSNMHPGVHTSSLWSLKTKGLIQTRIDGGRVFAKLA